MILQNLVTAIPSSALAPLFIEPEGVEVNQREDKGTTSHVAAFRLLSLFSNDSKEVPALVVHETERALRLAIPNLARTNREVLLARCVHVNYVVPVGRMYWDPQDGEVGVDWVLQKDGQESPSLRTIEYVMGCLLEVYAKESLYFFAMSVDEQPAQLKPALTAIAMAAKKRLEETFLPAIGAALESA